MVEHWGGFAGLREQDEGVQYRIRAFAPRDEDHRRPGEDPTEKDAPRPAQNRSFSPSDI
jgi:hypothetical protein